MRQSTGLQASFARRASERTWLTTLVLAAAIGSLGAGCGNASPEGGGEDAAREAGREAATPPASDATPGIDATSPWTDAATPDSDAAVPGTDASTDADAASPPTDAGADVTTSDSLGLDETGRTVPDTNYSIPAGAIFMSPSGDDANAGTLAAPVQTINRAAVLVPVGGTIVARAGVYRDWFNNGAGNYRINQRLFTLQAYPHEQAWFDGADAVAASSWTSDGAGHWSMAWSTPSFCDSQYYAHAPSAQNADDSGPCTHWDMYSTGYPAAGDPQDAFVDGARLTQVGTLAAVGAGRFFYDWTARRIYLGANPAGHVVELATRPVFLVSGVSAGGVVIRGVGFRRFATNEYNNLTSGALYIGGGGNNVIENCVFTQMAGQALGFASPNGSRVSHSVFAFNGFDGISANGHGAGGGTTDGFLVEDSLFNAQNVEHYGVSCSLSCASSHIKMGHMVGWTVRHNYFENGDPVTAGIWCDTDCHDGVTVENYLDGTHTDSASGIHYEINYGGIIASNVVVGFEEAINISAQDVRVYNNTLVDQSLISLRVYDDNRSEATTNIQFFNNVSWGTNVNKLWFALQAGGTNGPSTFITGLDYNAWYRPTSFVLYRWIDAADVSYDSTTSFRAAHAALEAHSADVVGDSDPFFVDEAAGNYRVRAGSPAYRNGGAIPSDVAATFGGAPSAGQDRGAARWATR